jgi:hypothetical protein
MKHVRFHEGPIAITALALLAFWLFVCLPLIYVPELSVGHHGEILGVKYGEWLLFAATAFLAWTTWLLVSGADKTAKRQLRAYVHPMNGRADRTSDNKIRVNLTLKNWGQTPAYELRHKTAVRFVPPEAPSGYSEEGLLVEEIVIPPGAEYPIHMYSRDSFDIDDEVEYRENRKTILVYGELIYRDAFDQLQTTTFRYEVMGDIWASRGQLRSSSVEL